MVITDRDILMAAILANPDLDLPRLQYADLMYEEGDPDRGAFIRLQIELAKTKHEPPCPGNVHAAGGLGTRCTCWRKDLVEEVYKLFHPRSGHGRYIGHRFGDGTNAQWFHSSGCIPSVTRGFVSSLTCTFARFLAVADEYLWWPSRKCEKCSDPKSFSDYAGRVHRQCSACRGWGGFHGAKMPCPGKPSLQYNRWVCEQCNTPWGDVVPLAGENAHCRNVVPRPKPPTAQPVTTVTFTDVVDFSEGGHLWSTVRNQYMIRVGIAGRPGTHDLREPVDTSNDEYAYIRATLSAEWPTVKTWNLVEQP